MLKSIFFITHPGPELLSDTRKTHFSQAYCTIPPSLNWEILHNHGQYFYTLTLRNLIQPNNTNTKSLLRDANNSYKEILIILTKRY